MEVNNMQHIRSGKFLGIFVRWWNVEADCWYETLDAATITHSPLGSTAVIQQCTLLTFHNTHLHIHTNTPVYCYLPQ